MKSKALSRRDFLKGVGLAAGGAALAACQPQTQQMEVTRVVEVPVEQKVEVTRVVEQKTEVTRVVEVPVEKKLIRWHHRLGGWDSYADCIRAFEEAHPEAKVNEEEFPAGSGEYGPKIASLVAAGMAGDLTWVAIGTGSFQFLAQAGALAELDDLIAVDTPGLLDAYYPRVVDSFRFGPGGHGTGPVCALPELAHANYDCLFFNKTMFEQAGVELPNDTWTLTGNLPPAAEALTNGTVFGYLPYTGDYSCIRYMTLLWGAELISEDGTRSLVEDDAVKQAIRWHHDLFFKSKVAPTAAQMAGDYDQMFASGLLASFSDGGWSLSIGDVVEDAFEWDMILMPKGPSGHRGGHLHTDGEAVFADSENKELAYEFAKFLTDKEAGVGIALSIGLAARPDVYTDSRVTADPRIVMLGKSNEEAAEHRGPANLRKQELMTTVKALFDPLWTGDAQPDDAWFAETSAALQEFLDKPAG